MSQTITLPVSVWAKNDALEKWMGRVLRRGQKVRKTWSAADVHDLRVALRRCRTMADVLTDTNPSPGWNKLKRNSKKVFHTLGELRDVQVEQVWFKKLLSGATDARTHLLKRLRAIENQRLREAQKELDHFDRKEWRKLSRKLRDKADIFPIGSVVFQRQALMKLNEAVALYHQARKRKSGVAWHRVRIAIKRFRYIVENFLPQHYEAWARDLEETQDLLGDIHDLDVLRTYIRRHSRELEPQQTVAAWLNQIQSARAERLEKFLAKTNGKESLWLDWRSGLQGGNTPLPVLTGEIRAAYSAS
ncbi:MAG TPA: CHAD domain-containing protein [Candidatus Acidoferrales bacterium]|nr:CHAD domain-containing protein [Candidatus Acidoferrales bacterium]